MNKYHISIHIGPHEIDNYQLFINQLRRNLNYVNNEIIFNPMLNLSHYFYDWDKSVLKDTFFINKFNELNKIVEDKVILVPIINFDNDVLGAFSYKRRFIDKYKNQVNAFIWFDSDLIFSDDLLYYLINTFEMVNSKHCIITPQIVKMWDNTWDVIVNDKYINQQPSHESYFNFDGYGLYNNNQEKEIIENISHTKFGAGWGNLLSSDLFKDYIHFNENFSHYGVDDTFIMYAVDIFKNKGHNIKQFIINNLIVTENNKFKLSFYNDLINKKSNIRTKDEFRQKSEKEMMIQLYKIQQI